jgi:SAM-dependent methyltransferase
MTGRLEACIRLAEKVGMKGKALVDVGCSFGWFCQIALDHGAKTVYGVEPDDTKRSLAIKAVKNAHFVKGDAGHIPTPRNIKFDIATLYDVIEHVPVDSEIKVFKEISRVLKPKGYLLISTPLSHPFSKITDPAWYFGHRHYSETKLTQMLKEAGFKVNNVETRGGMWEIIGMWVLYISKWIFRIPMPAEEWFDIRRRKEFKQKGFTHIMLIAQKIN